MFILKFIAVVLFTAIAFAGISLYANYASAADVDVSERPASSSTTTTTAVTVPQQNERAVTVGVWVGP